jgi:uracil-DNA glycosylase family 4
MSTQTDQQRRILADMGIDVWLLRDKAGKKVNLPAVDPSNGALSALSSLQNEVQSCQRCGLSQSRTQTVFGSGNANADLLLIGEAPGAEEDRQGLPFVGKAGKLLDAMLFAIGFTREQVYICNVLKCRPPNNRDPQTNEVESCAPFLNAQIGIVSPKVILALGRFAAHRLLQTEAPVYKMRESINVLPGTDIPVVVTYHPASLLRNPMQKAQSWNDLCKVHQLLEKAET